VDEAHLNLGLVLRSRERYREALECFERALELSPDYESALIAMADIRKAITYLQTGE
jgi:tetratricopeptide (TPR) repeat protein